MKNATFYLLNHNVIKDNLNESEQLSCDLALKKWREGKRVLIACENYVQAKKLDNALWIKEPFSFIPHNLFGSGPSQGAPVEINWIGSCFSKPRDVLISLLTYYADFSSDFNEIIEFIPYEEELKQLARNRYKVYRSIGFRLSTVM